MRRLALMVVVAMVAMTAVAVAASSQAASVSSSVDLPGATATAVSGNYAYVTASSVGRVTAVNISNPSVPTIAGESASSNALVNASNIAISGGYAYVVSKNRNGPQGSNQNDDGTGNALTILDIASNPAQPTIVGSVRDATNLFGGYGIAVSGGYAYVAAQGCLAGQPCPNPNVGNSFAVVNVSVPSSPTVVATLHNNSLPAPFNGSNSLDHPTSVAISGNYAYVTSSYSNRLTVIDISNPLNPTI